MAQVYESNEAFKTQTIPVSSINAGVFEIPFSTSLLSTPNIVFSYTFTDSIGGVLLPSAGLISFSAKTRTNPEYSEGIFDASDIDATLEPKQLKFCGFAEVLEVSGSGIVGADNVVVRIKGFANC